MEAVALALHLDDFGVSRKRSRIAVVAGTHSSAQAGRVFFVLQTKWSL
jgi:hypothetical protein